MIKSERIDAFSQSSFFPNSTLISEFCYRRDFGCKLSFSAMQLFAPIECNSWNRGMILAAVASVLVSAAQAQITLNFVYNSGTDTTTATYSGSWGSYTQAATFSPTTTSLTSGGGNAFDGSLSGYSSSGSFTGASLPWTSEVAIGHTGDSFAFNCSAIYTAAGYTAGTQIDGSLIFSGSDLSDLGFNATEIANGGTLGSGLNLVTWSASVAAVPEPASFSAVIGLFVLIFSTFGRRRNVRSQSI